MDKTPKNTGNDSQEQKGEWLENIIAITVVGIIVFVVIGLIFGWFSFLKPTGEEEEARYPITIGRNPTLGAEEAPVVIIEFSDFQCPYCAEWATTVKPQLQHYIDNGTVLFVFRDFPLQSIHPRAPQLAKAAQCAYEQGKFWEYHDMLYANQDAQELSHLNTYAEEIGLNTTMFDECFNGDAAYVDVERDINTGLEFGITGTPTLFINGRRFVGALPYEQLQEIIAEELVYVESLH